MYSLRKFFTKLKTIINRDKKANGTLLSWNCVILAIVGDGDEFYDLTPYKTIDKDQKKIVRLELISFPGLLQQAKSH